MAMSNFKFVRYCERYAVACRNLPVCWEDCLVHTKKVIEIKPAILGEAAPFDTLMIRPFNKFRTGRQLLRMLSFFLYEQRRKRCRYTCSDMRVKIVKMLSARVTEMYSPSTL